MPKLGNTVEECILAKWRKAAGEKVTAGEIIAEVETDKAMFEVPAPADGTLLRTFCEEGALVPVFTTICAIGAPGEDISGMEKSAPPPAAAAVPEKAAAAPAAPVPSAGVQAPPAMPGPVSREVFLSPRARRVAAELGFTPAPVQGSGPGGRVLEQDVWSQYRGSPRLSSLARKYVEAGYEARRGGSGINGVVLARDLDQPGIRMSGMRERIARRMRESLSITAQYTMSTSADATGLLALRARVKAACRNGEAPDINVNEMVMFATVKALADIPALNAEFIDGKIYRRAEIHLGFACDTDRGLLVPVVRNCEQLSLTQLAARAKELTQQALAGNISPDDLSGATFTVSNLGNLGVQSFTPILNPPQVALLGVDSIELKPVRRDGRIEFVDHIGLSLTCDHQVIDGAPGARFLKVVREKIESMESIADLKL